MFCLNSRVGILFRENLAKKSYELRYFFIDNEANLFYCASLPRLQKIIRLSKDCREIKHRLLKCGQKSFNLHMFTITVPKPYTTESVLPFGNRTCIEMREKDKEQKEQSIRSSEKSFSVDRSVEKGGEKTAYMMLGLMDQDTVAIYEEVMHLTGKKKKELPKRKSIPDKKQEHSEEKVFAAYIECSRSFSMDRNGQKQTQQKQKQKQEDNQYDGEQVEGKAEGKGKQILVSKGMTYSGVFKAGRKHGPGYLVDKNLDTMECQFVGDELAGI